MVSYRLKQATKLIDVSASSVRNYTSRYSRFFSSQATPEPGQERWFTLEDLRLIAFIAHATNGGTSHEEVAKQIDNGALTTFEWQPPEEELENQKSQEPESALVPVQQLQIIARLFDQQIEEYRRHEKEVLQREERAHKREEEALAREREMAEKLADAQRQIGELTGELRTVKSQSEKPSPWWRRLFGR